MEILEPRGLRFELALDRLRAGESFTFNGVDFWLAPTDHIEARMQSSWRKENVNEQTALKDMKGAERVMDELTKESSQFAALVKNRPKQFVLIDDYGTGAAELCRLVHGSFRWAGGMPLAANAV